MKKTTIILILLAVIFTASPAAQEITEKDVEFELVSENGIDYYKVSIPGIDNVTLKSESAPGRAEKKVISRFYNELVQIEGLTVSQASIIFSKEGFEAVIVPESFVKDDIDFASYLPAGLTFVYRTYTVYDFRMLKDNYFVRIRGEYFSPEDLLEKMKSAYDDPVKYIVSHNPEYVVTKLGELELENSNQESCLDKMEKEYQKLSEAHNDLMKQHMELMADYSKLKFAFIAAVKKGIYGSKKPVPQEHIDKVLAIKKANPSYTYNEIYAEMKSQGIKISKGKVALILNTYLGDF